ncbi:MAG: DUF21 domain-containing protein [Elusimicrobia bacterium]|nr:DUF21 domain-containing protein [Elusimicrobiota bacterium]
MSSIAHILGALGLIALNGCFVLAEFALVRVRASRVEVLARQGNARAVLLQKILQDLELYLSAIQTGITMASLGLGWIGQPAVARLLSGVLDGFPYGNVAAHGVSLVVAFALITFLHIIFGELLPRSIGIQRAESVALWAAWPLKLYCVAFKPLVKVLAGTSMRILRGLKFQRASEADPHFSEEEVRLLLGSTDEKAGFSLERLMLIENVFDFGAARVADAMVPKERVAFLSRDKGWEENLAVIRKRHFSRYPLCVNTLDSVVGYVHIKDILLASVPPGSTPDLGAFRRDLPEVSPGDSLQKLFQGFADRGVRMAVVRERKQVLGLLSLEDILEELVGEIHDEFDLPQAWSLMDVLIPAAVDVGVDVADREFAIRFLVTKLHQATHEFDAEEAFQAVWEREGKFSTAVGRGIAIPHARLPSLMRPLVAIGRAAKSFQFPAPDATPVRLVFLVLTPTATPVAQLKILARIGSLASNENLRRRLLKTKSREHFIEILRTADTVLAT